MSSSNLETLLSPKEHASQKWRPSFRDAICRCGGGIPVLQSRGAAAAGVPMSNTWKVRLDRTLRRGLLGCTSPPPCSSSSSSALCTGCIESRSQKQRSRIRIHCDAAVVSQATIRSDAAAHHSGRSVVFGCAADSGIYGAEKPTRSWRPPFSRSNSGFRRRQSVAALTGVRLALVTWLGLKLSTRTRKFPKAARLERSNHDRRDSYRISLPRSAGAIGVSDLGVHSSGRS